MAIAASEIEPASAAPVMALTGGRGVDVAIEAVGIPATFTLCGHCRRWRRRRFPSRYCRKWSNGWSACRPASCSRVANRPRAPARATLRDTIAQVLLIAAGVGIALFLTRHRG